MRNKCISKRKINIQYLYILILLIILACIYIVSLEANLFKMTSVKNLTDYVWESERFRQLIMSDGTVKLIKELENKGIKSSELLSVLMLDNNFNLSDLEFENYSKDRFLDSYNYKMNKRPEQFNALINAYQSILEDLVYFPVPISTKNEKATVSYENSWLAERTYGGKRGHEGTDLMASIKEPGYYPVVSMTDGYIEKIGWLEKGGWRIGVRSTSGAYFYYAHMYGYADGLSEGSNVKAGELLGYMGDTGYGEEGTSGKFAVHLHLGVYIKTDNFPELSVNPYWLLKLTEDSKLSYSY